MVYKYIYVSQHTQSLIMMTESSSFNHMYSITECNFSSCIMCMCPHPHTVPTMQNILWDRPWCIPRTQRTGSWPQALCWAVLSPWCSPAEALYAPLWVEAQGWAQPTAWSSRRHQIAVFQRSTVVKIAPAELERGCSEPLHLRPGKPPHIVARCLPGLYLPGEYDGIPLTAINISFPILSFLLLPPVSINVCLQLPPLKCCPVTCRGKIQPFQTQIEQGREEGQAPRQREKRKGGSEESRQEEEKDAGAVESPVADRLVDSLSLQPLLNPEPRTALQKMEMWKIPLHPFLYFSCYLVHSAAPPLCVSRPLHCLPPLLLCSLCSVMQTRSNAYCARWSSLIT